MEKVSGPCMVQFDAFGGALPTLRLSVPPATGNGETALDVPPRSRVQVGWTPFHDKASIDRSICNLNVDAQAANRRAHPAYPNTSAVQPLSVQLEQTILCDDMPPLAGIQLGPTSKSVARSYAATLNRLMPAGSPLCHISFIFSMFLSI
jgi:hypothetical protein